MKAMRIMRGLWQAGAAGLALSAASLAWAVTVHPLPTTTLTCTEVLFTGSSTVTWDRDNTGTGRERVRLEVRDGAGAVVYTVDDERLLGQVAGFGNSYSFTTAPTMNPLTVRLLSLAGNGLGEQVAFSVSGACAGLSGGGVAAVPALDEWGLLVLAVAAAGFGARRWRRGA